jgi:hypothetical protein
MIDFGNVIWSDIIMLTRSGVCSSRNAQMARCGEHFHCSLYTRAITLNLIRSVMSQLTDPPASPANNNLPRGVAACSAINLHCHDLVTRIRSVT